MKKLICMLIAAFTILPVCASAAIVDMGYIAFGGDAIPEAACEHQYRTYNVSRSGWYQINGAALMHEYRAYSLHYCDLCGEETETFVASQREDHAFVLIDNEHVDGENLHEYMYECDKCGYDVTNTIGCGGTGNGDCIIALSTEESQEQK